MKRYIMLNWRWAKPKRINKYFKKILINSDDVIILSKFSCKESYNKFIAQELAGTTDVECIVFTHYSIGSASTINIDPEQISKPKEFSGGFFVFKFGGGSIEDKVYVSDSNTYGLLKIENDNNSVDPIKTILKENFNSVWDYYRNLTLEEQKKKLIETFLPLAIDQQGLRQCSFNGDKHEYLEEVKAELEKNADKIIEDWNNIKNVLALKRKVDDKPVESLSEKLNDNEKKGMYFPIENENKPGFTKEELIDFVTSNEKNGTDKLIKTWLNEAVAVLDAKINPKGKK